MEAQANVVAFPSPHAIGIVKADIENGYTRMANDLVDALAHVELSGRQYRVFMAIIRKTYGYNKKSDWMAAEQIQKAMGYTGDITHIRADLRELKSRNLIVQDGRQIGPNTLLSEWVLSKPSRPKTVRKQTENGLPKTDRNQSLNGPKTVSKQTEIGLYTDRKRSPQKTKDNNSKNNIPKDNTRQTKSAALDLSNLPAWLSVASMEEFIRHRREIRKPLTPLALSKLVGKLETFRARGHDVQSILDESIANGWQGVFEPKGPRQTANVVDWNDTSWGDDLGEW